MAEDATNTASAVNDAGVAQDTTTTESAAVENKAPEMADPINWDDEAPAANDAKTEPAKEETETETEAEADITPANSEETNAEEQPQGKADERKAQLNTEIRDLVAQRNALRAEIEQANQVYQPQSEDDLVEQGYSPEMAAIEAMKQERQIERYNEQVANAQLTLESESRRALSDFPMFNPDSPDFNQELAANAASLLENSLVFDQNTGQVIGSNVPVYSLYSTLATASKASQIAGQVKGQKAVEQMIANSDSVGSAAPPKTNKDPLLSMWEED